MVRWALLLFILAGSNASAQTVMDNSDKTLSAENLTKLKEVLNGELSDPYGAQLQKLKTASPGVVCGYINPRNAYGGLSGFRPFAANFAERVVYIVPPKPQYDINAMKGAEEMEATRAMLQDRLDKLKAIVALCPE